MKNRAPGRLSAAPDPATLALRRAQRACADALDAHRGIGEFRLAQLRAAMRRTLSELSADDRARLAEWIALQLAAAGRGLEDAALGMLARVDTGIAVRVSRALPVRTAALAARAGTQPVAVSRAGGAR